MAPRGSAAVEIKLRWAGRPRTLTLGRWGAMALLVVLPILAGSSLCGSLYLVFHDDLLASLIQHQSEMQDAYEDRIAALKADLDSVSGAGAVEQDASSQAIRALAARGARLETRAATLETLTAQIGVGGSAALAPVLRLDRPLATGALEPQGGSYADRRLDAVAASLARAEAAETQAARSLRDPILRRVARLHDALAETGLPPSRWREPGASDAVGGPFVPLPAATGLDATLTLLGEATREQGRLTRIVERVPLRRPLDGPLEVTSPFGPRIDPFLGRAALHTGIDLHEDIGDAVKATAAGTVTIAGSDGGYGNLVEIDHGEGIATRYGHLSVIEVAAGQRVAAGAIVGRVGATGRATGPHLHYETRVDGEPVDPARFLKASAILFP